jgi:hypothetical protein
MPQEHKLRIVVAAPLQLGKPIRRGEAGSRGFLDHDKGVRHQPAARARNASEKGSSGYAGPSLVASRRKMRVTPPRPSVSVLLRSSARASTPSSTNSA